MSHQPSDLFLGYRNFKILRHCSSWEMKNVLSIFMRKTSNMGLTFFA